MAQATVVTRGAYHDSVALLTLARALRARPGVREAAVVMGTPANHDLLAQAGLLTDLARTATANDLIVVVEAETAAGAEAAAGATAPLLAEGAPREARGGRARPRTIAGAVRQMPDANLALISVPGAFAAAEARAALEAGLHVVLFSDNVALADEIALKRQALAQGLLLMGPDCGTAYVAGVPLGFANVVPRGPVGLVAASGTGLQQVATQLAGRGRGVSHAIGVGGRDMSEAVGGLMTLAGLERLGDDAGTELIVVIGKPPAPAVGERVRAALSEIGKPAVVCLLGRDVTTRTDGAVTTVATLEDAALAADAALGHAAWQPRPFSAPDVAGRIAEARRALDAGQSTVLGLFAGGTLAHESLLILEALLGPVASNLTGGRGRHRVLDLGADAFTIARAHPMLDPTIRVEMTGRAGEQADLAVLLLDVVLGHGAAADPAGDVAPTIEAARATARAAGRGLAVVASVVGTAGDPQGLAAQVARLEAAGVWVLPSNAQAARAAAAIAGGEPVLDRLLGPGARG